MKVDAIALELRPRPTWEAADLGVRFVQHNARSVWRTCLPVFAVVALLAGATVEIAPWLPALLLFWLKPWLDRSVLFVLSRAAFGQATSFADLWHAKRWVWGGQLGLTLLWRRLSPWRAFTQPALQLEGQRGAARRARRAQLLSRHRGAALGVQAAYAHVEIALVLALLALIALFAPAEARLDTVRWLMDAEGVASTLLGFSAYAGVVLLLEPFYVASGFAMYLNRRVQLEAWDIEQEFRRAF